jgi:hypothetical protein
MTATAARPTRIVLAFLMAMAMTIPLMGTANAQPTARGTTIQDISFTDADGNTFDGRLVNAAIDSVGEDADGNAVANLTGRLIGQITDVDGVTQRVNQLIDAMVPLVDALGNALNLGDLLDGLFGDGADAVQILYLELGPVFLDLLGLIVEIPDPIILEIRAERGPGQLLGNLLVGLLGALD